MNIVMMGDSNAGRTSIAKTIVQKIVSKRTMMLVETSKMEAYDFKIHKIDFKLYDFPTKYDLQDPAPNQQMILRNASALLYVMNPLEDHSKSLENFLEIHNYMKKKNTNNCQFFIFINKKDTQITDKQMRDDLLLQFKKKLTGEGIDYRKVQINFTSIIDYSIYEEFSKMIQKILPCTPYLSKILREIVQKSKISKIFIYDMYTKLLIAQSQENFQTFHYQLCSETVDIYNDIISLYQSIGDVPKPNPNVSVDQINTDKCQINLEFNKHSNIQIYKLERVNSGICICYIVDASNYDRPNLIEQNINILKEAILKYLNQISKFLS